MVHTFLHVFCKFLLWKQYIFRALMSILGMSMIGKCNRRKLYLVCCGIMIFGLLSLSCFSYFNHNELLTQNFPMARWIPIFSILIVYTGFSFGYAGIPYIFQVPVLASSNIITYLSHKLFEESKTATP